MVFDQIEVDLGAVSDVSDRIADQRKLIQNDIDEIDTTIAGIQSQTSGDASNAVIADLRRKQDMYAAQILKLEARITLLSTLASIYDNCDIDGARALGT